MALLVLLTPLRISFWSNVILLNCAVVIIFLWVCAALEHIKV